MRGRRSVLLLTLIVVFVLAAVLILFSMTMMPSPSSPGANTGSEATPTHSGGAAAPSVVAPAATEIFLAATPTAPAVLEQSGDTPPDTPVKIADARLLIRDDVSGDIIGDGTLQIMAPPAVRYPEEVIVRLVLSVDNYYITPTPVGTQGTPPPRATSVGGATPLPVTPFITDSGLPVYQRMGASLFCNERAFSGCDTEYNLSRSKIISSRSTLWEWMLSPQQNISGLQNLRLEVWIAERNLDGSLEIIGLEGTQYSFQIEVNPPAGQPPWVLLIAAVLVMGLIAGVYLRRRQAGGSPRPAQPVAGQVPSVFISYRRGSSWAQARSIAQSLEQRGAKVFIDVDDINEGRFAEIIETAIETSDYFVAVLAPDSLESAWVRREIHHALTHKRTIIPVLTNGFRLDDGTLPDDIRDIASHNAITLLPEFYEEAINRLASRFLKL